jgi:predicted dinucleotide-binding enzyme
MNKDDSALEIGHTSSGAEELARKVRGAAVVAAFQTVPSEVFFDVFEHRRRKNRPSLAYCGDDAKAKKVAATLIRDVGFEPFDIGGLQQARYTEPFALLIAAIAYNDKRGPEMAYRFEWSDK